MFAEGGGAVSDVIAAGAGFCLSVMPGGNSGSRAAKWEAVAADMGAQTFASGASMSNSRQRGHS